MSDQPGTSQTPVLHPRKRAKRTPVQMTENEKKIAINVYNYVEKTLPSYPHKKDVLPIVSEIMGVSGHTIDNLIKFYEKTGTIKQPTVRPPNRAKLSKFDNFTLTAIRRKVHQFYFDGELPTVAKVTAAINEDSTLPSLSESSVYRLMKKLNFNHVKRSRRSILLDRPDLQTWRHQYLQRIADYRKQNRKIYYLDETWLNEGHTSSYVWVDEDIKSSRDAFLKGLSTGLKNPSKGKRLIITHIGSEDGFVDGGEWIFEAKKQDKDGDYHGEMDAHNFEKWYEQILNKIPPGSVVVMDNAPYHSRHIEKVPTMNWRKDAIQGWLRQKNINYDEKEIKADLIAKIDRARYKKMFVDELSKSRGVTVLRLPPYHCELNPIELIWAQVKGYVGRRNKTFKMPELKALLAESLTRIGAEQWKKCVDHVVEEEKKMKNLDGIIDRTTDDITAPFVINTGDTSSSTDFSSESG